MSERLTDEQLAAMRQKHGRIKRVVFNGREMVFRAPTRQEAIQHMMAREDPQQKILADEQLARIIVVHPDRQTFASWCDEWPYLASARPVNTPIAELLGIVEDSEQKSLGSTQTGNVSTQACSPAA